MPFCCPALPSVSQRCVLTAPLVSEQISDTGSVSRDLMCDQLNEEERAENWEAEGRGRLTS